ncbi:MAG: cell division protein FtsZ [Methanobrevibacter sp.]|nr:cell division protein FtsZ [Methanobrevibacter sp.]
MQAMNKRKIIVVGIGGVGNNTITRINEMEIKNIHTIAINTDAQDLYHCQADEKILLGENSAVNSLNRPEDAEALAEENADVIKEKLEDANMVFISCGLGGIAGSGSAPVISKIAKKLNALTIAIVTMPLFDEGFLKGKTAMKSLKKLQDNADTVIVIPIDKLLEVTPNLTIDNAFLVPDGILTHVIKSIAELITNQSLLSLSFKDIQLIMEESGIGMVCIGESNSQNRAIESAHQALNWPLLDCNISEAKSAIINISASSNITLYESEKIVQIIADNLNPETEIVWGIQIDDSLENTIRTTMIITGIEHNLI